MIRWTCCWSSVRRRHKWPLHAPAPAHMSVALSAWLARKGRLTVVEHLAGVSRRARGQVRSARGRVIVVSPPSSLRTSASPLVTRPSSSSGLPRARAPTITIKTRGLTRCPWCKRRSCPRRHPARRRLRAPARARTRARRVQGRAGAERSERSSLGEPWGAAAASRVRRGGPGRVSRGGAGKASL